MSRAYSRLLSALPTTKTNGGRGGGSVTILSRRSIESGKPHIDMSGAEVIAKINKIPLQPENWRFFMVTVDDGFVLVVWFQLEAGIPYGSSSNSSASVSLASNRVTGTSYLAFSLTKHDQLAGRRRFKHL